MQLVFSGCSLGMACMTKPIRVVMVVASLCSLTGCFGHRSYEFPETFRGYAVIIHDDPNYTDIFDSQGQLVRFDDTGCACTRNDWRGGIFRESYYRVSVGKPRTAIDSEAEIQNGNLGSCRAGSYTVKRTSMFVGSKDDFQKQKGLAVNDPFSPSLGDVFEDRKLIECLTLFGRKNEAAALSNPMGAP
jgi:hypothetical protein